MRPRGSNVRLALVAGAAIAVVSCQAHGQAPTLGTETPPAVAAQPGSEVSTLGRMPGSAGGGTFARLPGAGQIIGARPGSSSPRVPTAITQPAGFEAAQIQAPAAVAAPAPLSAVPLFGRLELPTTVDDGPADGLTLDQAIERTISSNLDLTAKRFEIPMSQADALQASLRSNPLFYADSQLVPYGAYSAQRPGGQTQYDVNISYPIDYSRKRRARTRSAAAATRVTEALFQDAMRIQIAATSAAFVNVQAARETVRYAETGLAGLERVLDTLRKLAGKSDRTFADVARVEAQRDAAEIGVLDAREALRKAKLGLAVALNLTPEQAEALDVRGSLHTPASDVPPLESLTDLAIRCRPDVVAYRLGVEYAEAQLALQKANVYSDAYLLYQPYTFQSNAPTHLKSPTSWALGVTVPVPVFNRNQGSIARARGNIQQSRAQLAQIEQQAVVEVRQAYQEFTVTRRHLELFERTVLVSGRKALDDTRKLFDRGELPDLTPLLTVQREYNDLVRQYREVLIRHRRAMISVNTTVGAAIFP